MGTASIKNVLMNDWIFKDTCQLCKRNINLLYGLIDQPEHDYDDHQAQTLQVEEKLQIYFINYLDLGAL